MQIILSPAKNMRPPKENSLSLTAPCFPEETQKLYEALNPLSPWELEAFLKVNEKLAVQAFMDYKAYRPYQPEISDSAHRAALLSYDGLVFKNLKAWELTPEGLQFAQSHFYILSGFYGALRPMDALMPYRLEMQAPLAADGFLNLYQFWSDKLYKKVYEKERIVLNLASEEYAKAVRKYLTPFDTLIDVVFLTYKGGKLKTLATWAKMARGRMARYIIDRRLTEPEAVKAFSWDGYCFEESLSCENKYIFIK